MQCVVTKNETKLQLGQLCRELAS